MPNRPQQLLEVGDRSVLLVKPSSPSIPFVASRSGVLVGDKGDNTEFLAKVNNLPGFFRRKIAAISSRSCSLDRSARTGLTMTFLVPISFEPTISPTEHLPWCRDAPSFRVGLAMPGLGPISAGCGPAPDAGFGPRPREDPSLSSRSTSARGFLEALQDGTSPGDGGAGPVQDGTARR